MNLTYFQKIDIPYLRTDFYFRFYYQEKIMFSCIVYTAKLRVTWSSGHLKSDTAKILSQEILAVALDTRFDLLVKHWTISYPDNVM